MDLTEYQQKTISDYIIAKRHERIFVLSRGDLESYLPTGYKSKQLDKLIRFISKDFWVELPEFAKVEISVIADGIRTLS